MVKKIRFFPRSEYGMWKDGSTIYKDEKEFYIKQWNQKKYGSKKIFKRI